MAIVKFPPFVKGQGLLEIRCGLIFSAYIVVIYLINMDYYPGCVATLNINSCLFVGITTLRTTSAAGTAKPTLATRAAICPSRWG